MVCTRVGSIFLQFSFITAKIHLRGSFEPVNPLKTPMRVMQYILPVSAATVLARGAKANPGAITCRPLRLYLCVLHA